MKMILIMSTDLPDQHLLLIDKHRQNTLLISTCMSPCFDDSNAAAACVALTVHKVKLKGV